MSAYVRGSATHERRYGRNGGPTPAEQLRLNLTDRRREGVPFATAWVEALDAIQWRCSKYEREAWTSTLHADEVRHAFAAAYAHRQRRATAVVARLDDCLPVEADVPPGPVHVLA